MLNFYAPKPVLYIVILLATLAVTGCAHKNQPPRQSLPPISVDEELSIANAEFRVGKNDAAYRAYTNVLSKSPQSHKAYYGRGLAALQLGKTDQALFDFSRACEIAPDNMKYLREKGIAQAKTGKVDKALTTLNDVIKIQPEDDKALLARGIAYASQNKQKLAIADFTTLIKKSSPLRASAYYNRAKTIQTVSAKQALNDYSQSQKLAPQDSRPLNNRGLLLLSLGRYNEAHNSLDAAIAINNSSSQLFFNRAIIRENLGKYTVALEDYDKALSLNRRNTEAIYNRGILHQRMGNREKACTDLKKASDMGLPDRYESSIKMGLCE